MADDERGHASRATAPESRGTKVGVALVVILMIAAAVWLRFGRNDTASQPGAAAVAGVPPTSPTVPALVVPNAVDAPAVVLNESDDVTLPVTPNVQGERIPVNSVRFVRPDGRPVREVQVFGLTGGVPEAWSDHAGLADLSGMWNARNPPRLIVRWRSGADVVSGRYADGSPFYGTPFLARRIVGLTRSSELEPFDDVALSPGKPVTGVVRRSGGKLAANIVVKLYLDYVYVMSAVTDASGAFTFNEVGGDPHLIVIGDSPRTIVDNVRGGVPRIDIRLRPEDE